MSKKLKLNDREWKEFVFGDLFDISSTSSSIDKKRLTGILGNNPYITRSENNNGIDGLLISRLASRWMKLMLSLLDLTPKLYSINLFLFIQGRIFRS